MTGPDVLVAGGGPAGLAAAIAAAQAGMAVTVVDPRLPPVDKACGEGLMPGGVAALAGLGVHPDGVAFRGIRYVHGPRHVEAEFAHGSGLGVRRTVLHARLAARADALGVAHVVGRVGEVTQDGQTVHAAGLTARWLLAADGLHSPLRRQLGLDAPTRGRRRYGLRRHYALRPWTDMVEVHWSAGGEAYVTPVARDTVGVAVLFSGRGTFDDLLAGFPTLSDRLAGAPACGPVRGAGPLRQRARRRVAGRVLLVGDAAGYVDALTGEGVALAVRSAETAVACLRADDPARYERAWRRLTRRYRALTSGLLAATAHPNTRAAIVPAATAAPWAYRSAVNLLA